VAGAGDAEGALRFDSGESCPLARAVAFRDEDDENHRLYQGGRSLEDPAFVVDTTSISFSDGTHPTEADERANCQSAAFENCSQSSLGAAKWQRV
jgi:hypothetical protein